MTRKRTYWVARSGGLVNLSLDVGDDPVSGLGYVSRASGCPDTRQGSPEGRKLGQRVCPVLSKPAY